MRIRLAVFLLAIISCLLPGVSTRPAAAAPTGKSDIYWFFVVAKPMFRGKTSKPIVTIRGKALYIFERAALPDSIPDYSAKKKVIEYFDANVVEPAKKRGITSNITIKIWRLTEARYSGRARARTPKACTKKISKTAKNKAGTSILLEMVFGPAKGEETSKPKLIHRNKEQPDYESSKP